MVQLKSPTKAFIPIQATTVLTMAFNNMPSTIGPGYSESSCSSK
jgi:hypothetical protein